jgi:hypothetical protein
MAAVFEPADSADSAKQDLLELLNDHEGLSIDLLLSIAEELFRLTTFGLAVNHSFEQIIEHIKGGTWHSLIDALLSGENQFAFLRKWFIDRFHAQQRAHVEALTPLLFKQHARRRLDEAARTISTTFNIGVDLAPLRDELQLSWSPKIENSKAKLCEESEKWLAFLAHVEAP